VELPLLHQDAATGLLTAQSVLELHTLTAAAASRRDFRTAAHLQTMLDVLGGGRPPLPLSAFTAEDPDRAADIFLEHGFCVLPRVVSELELARMRATYETDAAELRASFEHEWAKAESISAGAHSDRPIRADLGKYYSFSTQGPAFVPLLDPTLLQQVMHRVLGQPVLASAAGGRVVPVADSATAHATDGYISWHRDISGGLGYDCWPFPHSRSVKTSVFLYDVPEDGAPLTILPGSHRLPNAPQQTLAATFRGGRGHYRAWGVLIFARAVLTEIHLLCSI
jgi:ectoine hydroxylase-related dioxygenase (phytanoyl-CoA dioxygenase family)